MYFDGFLRYDGKKKIPVVCLAKKKRYSCLSVGCAVLAITTGKKRYSRLSGGLCCCIVFCSGPKQSGVLKCYLSQYQKMKIMSYVFQRVSLLRPEKKVPVVCLAKKKRYSRLSVGCAVLAITTRKKRYSRLSDGLCCCIVFCSGGKF